MDNIYLIERSLVSVVSLIAAALRLALRTAVAFHAVLKIPDAFLAVFGQRIARSVLVAAMTGETAVLHHMLMKVGADPDQPFQPRLNSAVGAIAHTIS